MGNTIGAPLPTPATPTPEETAKIKECLRNGDIAALSDHLRYRGTAYGAEYEDTLLQWMRTQRPPQELARYADQVVQVSAADPEFEQFNVDLIKAYAEVSVFGDMTTSGAPSNPNSIANLARFALYGSEACSAASMAILKRWSFWHPDAGTVMSNPPEPAAAVLM